MPDNPQLTDSLGKSDSSSETSGQFYKDEVIENYLSGDVYNAYIFLHIDFVIQNISYIS